MTRPKLLAALAIGALLMGAGALLPARGSGPARPAAAAEQLLQPSLEDLEAEFVADPTSDEVAADLGLAYLAEVRSNADPRFYPKAEVAFGNALELDPQNFEATFGSASLAVGRHDFHTSLSWSRKAIELNPYNSDAWGIAGDSLIELGRYEAATRALQKMVDLRPGLPSFARISYLHELKGELGASLAAMKQAFAYAGTPGDAAFAASHIGDLHLTRRAIAEAEKWYVRGSELDPTATQPLAGLAKIAAVRGDLDGAIGFIQRLLEINEEPGNAVFLGDLYTAAGDGRSAEMAYELGLRLNRRETANGSNVKLEESLFAADHRQPRKALRLARSEYRIRQSIHVSDAYAWALYANGKFRQARGHAEDALRLGTKSALFHFHAGMIDLALDRIPSAIDHFTKATSLNPVFNLQHAPTAERLLECLTGECSEDHR